MRTTTLLCAVVAGAAAVVSAVAAEVYSVNAVGYVNTAVKPGFNLINNPLDAGAGNNTVSKLLANLPDGSIVYTYSGGAYSINTWEFGTWTNPDQVIVPGMGFWLRYEGTTPGTITFVGEVKQGNLNTPLVKGFNLVASQVPQAGKVSTDLKLPVAEGDIVYTYVDGNYTISTYEFGAWAPSEPTIAVGQGFWVSAGAAADWQRTFSVNP